MLNKNLRLVGGSRRDNINENNEWRWDEVRGVLWKKKKKKTITMWV